MAKTPNTNIGPTGAEGGSAGDDEVTRFCARYQKAHERRTLYNTLIDECYEYALPLRERRYSTGDPLPDMTNLYDSTAIADTQALASQMLDDIWPTDSKPFELVAGNEIAGGDREEVNRALAEVADDLIETINNSNFRSAAHEALMDWCIGEGYLLAEEGDEVDPLVNRALPLTEAVTDFGPKIGKDFLAREVQHRAATMKAAYPDAKQWPAELSKLASEKPDEMVTFLEGFERDWSSRDTERWVWRVVAKGKQPGDKKHLIHRREVTGIGSKPFVDFAYTRVAREIIGRGPVMLALPDIKTLNLVKQLVLEHADLAIGGVWQADDDGVLNVDTVLMEPRAVNVVAPNSRGLQRVDTGSEGFNVADIVIGDLQNNIHQIMLGDDLGPPEGTPMSATEVLQRTSNTARRRAGPYTRLLSEFLMPYIRRVAYIRRKQGRIKLPDIDGRRIVLRPLSPLTRAQAQDEILRHARFMEMGNTLHGPQQMALAVDAEQSIAWLAEKFGEDPRILRSAAAKRQLAEIIAQMSAVAEQQQGVA